MPSTYLLFFIWREAQIPVLDVAEYEQRCLGAC